jgi:ornithine cyclodeaminase/alanine dehydrogenase-like protein (mu-crystallin family)
MAHRPRHVGGAADLRTPAVSLAGLDQFARRDARRVGIYGSGQQAYSTFVGLTEMRKIESAKVYSPTPEHREFCQKDQPENRRARSSRRKSRARRPRRRYYFVHDQY